MLKKALVAAALAGLSTAALANPPHWAPAYGYRAHHHYNYAPYYRPYVRYYPVAPRPVIVAPAPIVVPPPPAIVFRLRFPL